MSQPPGRAPVARDPGQEQARAVHRRAGDKRLAPRREAGGRRVFDRDANRMYCILTAPDEDAVRRHHLDAGVPLETIHRADTLL